MIYRLPESVRSKLLSFQLVESNLTLRRLAFYLALIFILSFIAMLLIPWQQTARGTGRVVAFSPSDRQQNIDAPVEGRLGQWFVHEGSVVKAGDPIVEIFDNDPDILLRLKAEREAISKRMKAARIAAQTAKINVERQKELFETGISSRRAYEQAELEYARYLTDEANSSAELSRIEVRVARQAMQSVKAPRAGTILRRMSGQESELVKAGDVLAVLVPETESRAVELWIDGNDIPLVQENRHVRLQFEGWPAVQFSGWPSVAVGTFGGKVSFIDPADNGYGKFRTIVIPEEGERWPAPRYLRQGVRANGWVLLNEVTVGFELWRQFNGFPPALPESFGANDLWAPPAVREENKK